MERNVALILYFANITTIKDLSELDPDNVREILCFCNEQTKNSEQSKDKEYTEGEYTQAQKILCNYYEKEIKEFIEKAKKINENKTENN